MSSPSAKGLTRILTVLAIAGAMVIAAVPSQAQERTVAVNGVLLSPEQLAMLDRLADGYVPSGAYWIEPETGVWGYLGDPSPRGRISGPVPGIGDAPIQSAALDRVALGPFASNGN